MNSTSAAQIIMNPLWPGPELAILLVASSARRRPEPVAVTLRDVPPARGELACQELVELATEYLEDVLPPGLRDEVQTHLAGCDGCTEYVRQIEATVHALQEADLHLAPRPQLARASNQQGR